MSENELVFCYMFSWIFDRFDAPTTSQNEAWGTPKTPQSTVGVPPERIPIPKSLPNSFWIVFGLLLDRFQISLNTFWKEFDTKNECKNAIDRIDRSPL